MNDSDKLDKGIVLSVVFHALLGGVVLFSSSLFPTLGDASWGTDKGGAGGVEIKMVGNLSGVPLPAPEVVRENSVANESEGLYSSPPVPEPPATPDEAEPVPEKTAPAKVTPKPAASKTPPKPKAAEPSDAPANAVPYGDGGKPAMSYGSYQTGAGQAGVAIGDGTFGTQYGYYVDAMTRRISQNWLQALISAQVNRAPRVYLTFDISRDGTISNAEIKQGSGIPSLDNSALRAIRASNPLSPLPAGYRGSSVTVSFYFEYVR
jgi:periplasmic protein TonB